MNVPPGGQQLGPLAPPGGCTTPGRGEQGRGKLRGVPAPLAPVEASVLNAVLFVPPGSDFERWRDICVIYCHTHHYAVVAIATTWSSAWAMIAAGEAAVAVIGQRHHLPADRLPRFEVVAEEPAEEAKPERRPRRM